MIEIGPSILKVYRKYPQTTQKGLYYALIFCGISTAAEQLKMISVCVDS